MIDNSWTGFSVENGRVCYHGPDLVVSYDNDPAAMLIDTTAGFIQAGSLAAMQARIDRMVNVDPSMADDLVLVPIRPTQESVAQANAARDNPTRAIEIARKAEFGTGGQRIVTSALH